MSYLTWVLSFLVDAGHRPLVSISSVLCCHLHLSTAGTEARYPHLFLHIPVSGIPGSPSFCVVLWHPLQCILTNTVITSQCVSKPVPYSSSIHVFLYYCSFIHIVVRVSALSTGKTNALTEFLNAASGIESLFEFTACILIMSISVGHDIHRHEQWRED